jgi:hypothetical protein
MLLLESDVAAAESTVSRRCSSATIVYTVNGDGCKPTNLTNTNYVIGQVRDEVCPDRGRKATCLQVNPEAARRGVTTR